MKRKEINPPRLPDRFLQWFCAEAVLETLQGDLYELYEKRREKKGKLVADMHYAFDVLSACRSFAFRRRHWSNSNNTTMFTFYFKMSWRALRKNRGFSLLNITGLSIGIASCFLIFLIVKQEYSYDKRHAKADRIYRIETTKVEQNDTYWGTPTGVPVAVRSDFHGVDKVAAVFKKNNKIISINQSSAVGRYKESVAFVEESLFEILDFKWLKGNAQTALNNLNTVVIAESYAQKYFGSVSEAVGNSLRMDEQDWLITDIVADPPANTSFPFHLMFSYANLKKADAGFDQQHGGWSDNHQTFVVLQNGASKAEVEQQFRAMIEKYMGKDALQNRAYRLLPLSELHFSYNFGGRTADVKMLNILVSVGLFLLLIACANFINLATARGIKRSREVGVRKVLGSSKNQLVLQFLSEAGLVAFLSLSLSIAIAVLVLPYTNQLMGIAVDPALIWNVSSLFFLLSIFAFTCLLAGLYPALILSSLSPVRAMKNAVSRKSAAGISFRNGLVVFQFFISAVLIIDTLIINQQLNLFRNADLGFNYQAIITTGLPDNSPSTVEVLRQELLVSPLIESVSFSYNSASAESNWMSETRYVSDGEVLEIHTQMKMVDSHFIDTYGIDLIAGEDFRQGDLNPKAIINEVMVNRMGLETPGDAIGKTLEVGENAAVPIVGVVRNFHVNSLHQKIDPTVLQVRPQTFYQANIKLSDGSMTAANIEEALAHIENTWSAAFPDAIFDYRFLDQTLEEAYRKEIQTAKLVNLITGIAIFISCLGLFGLMVFTAEQRVKEIGVRKVLGASVGSIVALFSKEYFKLIFIANIIAWPVSWWIMDSWLADFEYRAAISWWVFVVAVVSCVVIAGLTISFQAIKAATANPVNSLRSE